MAAIRELLEKGWIQLYEHSHCSAEFDPVPEDEVERILGLSWIWSPEGKDDVSYWAATTPKGDAAYMSGGAD